jgi:hypothetical protein
MGVDAIATHDHFGGVVVVSVFGGVRRLVSSKSTPWRRRIGSPGGDVVLSQPCFHSSVYTPWCIRIGTLI